MVFAVLACQKPDGELRHGGPVSHSETGWEENTKALSETDEQYHRFVKNVSQKVINNNPTLNGCTPSNGCTPMN